MKKISVIICSKEGRIDQSLSNNIHSTIGCDYDLIVINNSSNKYSIFEAYNIGLKKSTTSIVVFIHEDILFHSEDWGVVILKYLQKNNDLGLIGVAGSKVRTKIPSAWWDNPQKYLFQNIIHRYPNGKSIHEVKGFQKEKKIEEVSVIDGVFIAMRKDENLNFNEKLKGFHNYDQSISLDFLNMGYKIWVTNEVLIEHFSLGKIDKNWLESTVRFNKIYENKLPQQTREVNITKGEKIYILERFLSYCVHTHFRKVSFKFWVNYFLLNPKSDFNLKMLKFYLPQNRIFRIFK